MFFHQGLETRRDLLVERDLAEQRARVQGLEVGDQVILSDMSAWDGHDRIKLN